MNIKTVCAVAVLLTAAGCASAPARTTSVPTLWEGFRDHPHGYLAKDDAPDASAFLPPPPEAGSLRQQDDIAIYHAPRSLEGSDRWRQAASDNEIETPSAPRIFSAALGLDFDPDRIPTLARCWDGCWAIWRQSRPRPNRAISAPAPSSPSR